MFNILLVSIIKSGRIYMNKLFINDLTNEEYIVVYSILMSIIGSLYCYYRHGTFKNIKKLTLLKFSLIALSGILSLYLWQISFNAVRNGTIVNTSFMTQGSTLLMVTMIGMIFFKEKMPINKGVGIGLVLIGLIVLSFQ